MVCFLEMNLSLILGCTSSLVATCALLYSWRTHQHKKDDDLFNHLVDIFSKSVNSTDGLIELLTPLYENKNEKLAKEALLKALLTNGYSLSKAQTRISNIEKILLPKLQTPQNRVKPQ